MNVHVCHTGSYVNLGCQSQENQNSNEVHAGSLTMAENGCHSHIQINKITVKSSELMNMNAMLIPFFRSQEKSVLLQSVWKTQKVNRFATRCGKDRIFRTKVAFSRKHRLAVLCLGEKKKWDHRQSNKCEKTKQNWRNNRKTEAVSD